MGYRASLKASQPPPTPTPLATPRGLEGKISPGVLLAIVVAAAIFFASGLLHLLVRCFLRPTHRELEEEPDGVTVRQGQLQQLFYLHDAGVDHSFMDALPVFLYRAVVGPKEGSFDCAVCLCEFELDDRLRLLPRCSHAFHVECIDTWLLAHTTCPLCRGSLVADPTPARPAVLVLESRGESAREVAVTRCDSSQLGHRDEEDPGSSPRNALQRPAEGVPEDAVLAAVGQTEQPSAMVLPVKLGKFRSVDVGGGGGGGGEGSSLGSSNVDERRCFSMGAFEYVMDETSLLRVAIRPPARKPIAKRPGHRPAMSDFCGRGEGPKLFQSAKTTAVEARGEDLSDSARIGARSRQRESFSVSKVWLRPRKERGPAEDGPRRAFSLRLPMQQWRAPAPAPEMEAAGAGAEKGGGEAGIAVESWGHGGRVVSREEETPSFTRRTLQWIVGRHHRVMSRV